MAGFVVPQELGGMTPFQLSQKYGGDIDFLSSLFGVGRDVPLQAGYRFTPTLPPGRTAQSGEYQFIQSHFTPAEQYDLAQQEALKQEERARLGEFTGRVQRIPETLRGLETELGIPAARELYAGAGSTLRGVQQNIRDLPEAVKQAAMGKDISANQLGRITSKELQEFAPTLEAATRGTEEAGATLQSLLGAFQTRAANVLAPFQIEAGVLGQSVAQEFDLFKTNISSQLDRELANLSRQTTLDVAEMNRLTNLAQIEASTSQGTFQDLGDRVALINPFTGEEVKSFSKGKLGTLADGW